MYRQTQTVTAAIGAGAALSGAIRLAGYASGVIQMPVAWTAANIGFKVCSTIDGTFLPLYAAAGTLVEVTSPAASKAMAIPDAVFAAPFVKLWSQDGSGNNTNQAAARTLTIDMRS